MTISAFEILNNAKQKLIEGEQSLASTLYSRATIEGVPSNIVNFHRATKGYMYLPMAESSPINYFVDLKAVKKLADKNDAYKEEYKNILETLVNFKSFFLRDVALNYFCEVTTCSWGSNYGKSLDNLYLYLEQNISDIVVNDCYGLSVYKPQFDTKKLERDLKTVQAFALNLLLMYVTHKSTEYVGKSYTANTMDFGDYSLTQVKSHDNYSHNAMARPRLFQVQKDAYYPDYLKALKTLSSELKIDTAHELKKEVSRLVDLRGAKTENEKQFFKYSKLVAKEDLSRKSYYSTFGSLYPGYNKLIKPILKVCLGTDEVGSFNLDNPFTRKRWLGVCNMIAWANDWSIEMVRTIMFICGCMGIGLLAYLGLYIAMKAKLYIPNFSVEKHI